MSTDLTVRKSDVMPMRPLQRSKGDMFELMLYWRSIAKRKWAILAVALAAAVLALIVSFMMTPMYRATATVVVEQNRSRVVSIEEVYSGVNPNREHFETQVDILGSRALAAQVINKLKLASHPEFDPRQREPSFSQRALDWLGIGSESEELTEKQLPTRVQDAFAKRLLVEPGRLSQVIRVSFDASDRQLAADIANTLVDTYIQNDIDTRSRVTDRASGWLDERLKVLKKNLEQSERALQDYRERQGIVDTKGLVQSGAVRQIEDLTRTLVEARQRRAEAESAYNQIKSAKNNVETLPAVQRSPLMARLKELEGDAERRYAELSRRYGPEHPRMIQAESELKQARENTRRQVQTLVVTLGNEFETARANERAIERTMAEAKAQVQGLNRKEFQMGGLERAANTNRQLYETFLTRFKETSAGSDVPSGGVARISDPAVPAVHPVRPKKMAISSIVFGLALFFAMLGAVLLERLDNTVNSVEDIEEKLGEPMLAMLPLLHGDAARYAGTHFLDDPTSAFSEGIRTTRTGVLLSSINVPRKILLVTSAISSEGKTAVAVNLALAHAQTQRVLLVDADMRKPAVAAALGLDQGHPGLSELVIGAMPLSKCLQRIDGSTLEVITCGAAPPDPLELMLTPRFQHVVAGLAEGWDIVVFDSPPIHLVSDAGVLAKLATGVVFVIKANSTHYRIAQRSIAAIRAVDARLLGIVLNQLDFKKADRYYGAYTGEADGYYTQPQSSRGHRKALSAKREATAKATASTRRQRLADSSTHPAGESAFEAEGDSKPERTTTSVAHTASAQVLDNAPEVQPTLAAGTSAPDRRTAPLPDSQPAPSIQTAASQPKPVQVAAAEYVATKPVPEPQPADPLDLGSRRQVEPVEKPVTPRPAAASTEGVSSREAPAAGQARKSHTTETAAKADPYDDLWEQYGYHPNRKKIERTFLQRLRSLWA